MRARKTKSEKAENAEKREVPEYKIKIIKDLADNIKKNRTLLLASSKGLPSSQFHEIKKNLRGKAIIKFVKKSAAIRALDAAKNSVLDKLKGEIKADIALFFSNLEPFALSALLADNQSPSKAGAGDIAPEDINIEPGPTNLVPGPAISELSGVGLKVAVEGGKLAIKLPATVAKKGDVIKPNLAGVLAKLDIKPMRVGFEPIAAFDSEENKVYVGIKIDKKKTLEELQFAISKSLAFAVSRGYPTKETISFIIGKAGREEIALADLVSSKNQTSQPSQTSPAEPAVQPAASS